LVLSPENSDLIDSNGGLDFSEAEYCVQNGDEMIKPIAYSKETTYLEDSSFNSITQEESKGSETESQL
jgi:hypothetical protein